MIPKSARFHVMTWYLFILAVTLSLFSLLIYGNFKRSIYEDLDGLLIERAQDVADSVSTYIKLKAEMAGGATDPLRALTNADFLSDARDWVEMKGKELELMSVAVQILDHRGKMITSSSQAPKLLALDEDDLGDILAGEESFDIVKGEMPSGKKERFRMYSSPVKFKGKVICVVQTVSHINLLELALHNLGFVLCLFLPLTVLLAGIPGIFLIKMTLSPVDKMTTTLKKITAGNLKLRIHVPETNDEIKRLADTFNQMLDRLDRSLECQDSFVEAIAGELREPFESLKKDMGTVLAQESMDEKSRKILLDGLKRVEIVSQSLEALVILTNIEEGNVPLEIRRTDVSVVAADALRDFAPKTSAKNIELVSYVDPGIMIDCDQSQVKELFRIILDNAVKYTNRDGKIVVTVKKHDTDVRILISDTGVGMPEEEIPYIFDRFYQIGSGKNKRNGFGIGLSVAKVIVEEHNGKIEVSSQWGHGSTFTISLPISYKA